MTEIAKKNIRRKEIATELREMINPEQTVQKVVEVQNDFCSIAPICGND